MGSIPRRNDLMSRIEALERLVDDLKRPHLSSVSALAALSADDQDQVIHVTADNTTAKKEGS